jgi:3-phytase
MLSSHASRRPSPSSHGSSHGPASRGGSVTLPGAAPGWVALDPEARTLGAAPGSRSHNPEARWLAAAALGLIVVLAWACGDPVTPLQDSPVLVPEAFFTPLDPSDDVDSPAAWRGPDGGVILLATAKATHLVLVYDGATGALLGRVGGPGSGKGEFQRPNGILVHGDHLFVVERDNRRVQVFTLPDFASLQTFGKDVLLKPYGITGVAGDGHLDLWITDDFHVTGKGSALWENRVKRFRVVLGEDGVDAHYMGAFGEPAGPGRLTVVESILADPLHQRLFIADEKEGVLKVYDLEGAFTGMRLGKGIFVGEPEGLALYSCGADGYLVAADQSRRRNGFHVFHRSSLAYLGSFRGERVSNTDGVALLQGDVGGLTGGAFYAVHDDRGVAAFSWASVAEALGLRGDCHPE